MGTSKNGDEILKFRDVTANGPIQWSDTDAGVHDMRRAMSKLEHEIKRLEIKAKKYANSLANKLTFLARVI